MSRYRVVPAKRPVWPALLVWLFAAVLGAGIGLAWPEPEKPGFRPACEAQGGVVVRLDGGDRLCLWAGAVIPVTPP